MTSKRRKILFLFFILIFAILSPLVLFYAAGYRMNWTWPPKLDQTFQKTGMLVLETEPAGARIYIDGELQKDFLSGIFSSEEEQFIRTPAKIKYIAAGQYRIRLEKDGYWSWEKELTVHSGKQTKLEDITLFEKNLPLKVTESAAGRIYTSPDKRYAVLPNSDLLVDLNTEATADINAHSEPAGSSTSTPEKVAWSGDSKKFLLGTRIYKTTDPDDPLELKKILGSDIKNIKWRNDSTLYYQSRNSIGSFELDTEAGDKTVLSSQENVDNYLPQKEYIYTIITEDTRTYLKIYSTEDEKELRRIELPYSSDYTFIHPSHDKINLYDENYDILYLIDPFSPIDPVQDIIENVLYTDRMEGNKLICANKFEIWSYDSVHKNKTLLTRISEPIIGVNWHPTANYILYYTKTGIHIIEAGERNKRNITTLIKLDKIHSPVIKEGGDLIYFNAEIGRNAGLYKLNL